MTGEAVRQGALSRVPLGLIRKVTIDNLRRSRDTAVPVTLHTEARADGLLRWHRGRPAREPVTMTVLVARVLVQVLARHPDVNCRLEGSDLVRPAGVNLGIAVAQDDGNLLVPVLHAADSLSLSELADGVRRIAEAARHDQLAAADMRGATFTLSSVGMVMGHVFGSPVLPPGQTGILLVGGVEERPVVQDGEVVVAPVVSLSLTLDHQVVNGVPALRFFAELRGELQEPDECLT